MNRRRGRVPPRTDPTSGTFASTPPTCDRSNRSAREALHSRSYVRRETRNSGRTDRPRATPGRARSRPGPSPTTREGGSRSRVPSVSFAPTIRPRVRRPVADKRGTRVKFVRTRVAFETRAGSPPPRPPPRPPRGVRSERCSGRGSLRPRGVPRPTARANRPRGDDPPTPTYDAPRRRERVNFRGETDRRNTNRPRAVGRDPRRRTRRRPRRRSGREGGVRSHSARRGRKDKKGKRRRGTRERRRHPRVACRGSLGAWASRRTRRRRNI